VSEGRRPARFEQTIEVQPEDIDEQGHVNNVVYVRWVQDVAGAHWTRATTAPERAALAWVVLRHEIDYKLPARLGDRVIARTWVGENTAATYERHVELLRAADGRLLARARSLWCPVDPRTGRPRRMDPALNERFFEP
jgi:acyl-CoA thioester hydrolase